MVYKEVRTKNGIQITPMISTPVTNAYDYGSEIIIKAK